MPEDATMLAAIRAEMARRGVTQRAIGDMLGLSIAAVSERLNGRTPIKVSELKAIAEFLDVPIGTFLHGAPLNGQHRLAAIHEAAS